MLYYLLFLPTLACGLANTFNPLPEYQFSWTADTTIYKLSVQVKLAPPEGKKVGWVGFGIAGGGGGMLGGDMFTAYSTGDATCAIQDRQADDSVKMMPKEDITNSDGFADWNLDSCSFSGGILTVGASRAFVTYDAHDLDFVTGPMKLLFAWGQTTPTSPSSLVFHDGGYAPKQVSLWGAAVPVFDKSTLESDYDMLQLQVNGLPIGPGDNYMCTSFNLTTKDGKPTQAIVFEPQIEEINTPYVHHMVLYTCLAPVNSTPFSCWSMPPGCQTLLWAWGKGGNAFVLPSVTGMDVGSTGRVYAALQIHYSNTGNVAGLVDNSGVNVYRTNQIRATQTGLYLTGNMNVSIPPQKSAFTLSGGCVDNSIPASGVTAYSSFPHAHQRGRRIWTNIIRNGTVIGTLGNNQNYDFNMQQMVTLSPTVLMLPGDKYTTYCTYDTSKDNHTVTWGETTADEMCVHFLAYYPMMKYSIATCGFNDNPPSANSPGPNSCVLLPSDPPVAYRVDGWSVVDLNFLTGGNATCAPGFSGEAQLNCDGFGAPFTFSGCVRGRGPTAAGTTYAPSGPPTFANGASVTPCMSVVVLVSLLLLIV